MMSILKRCLYALILMIGFFIICILLQPADPVYDAFTPRKSEFLIVTEIYKRRVDGAKIIIVNNQIRLYECKDERKNNMLYTGISVGDTIELNYEERVLTWKSNLKGTQLCSFYGFNDIPKM